MAIRKLELVQVSTRELELHPDNPRRGNVDAIKDSLEANAQYKPLVVDNNNRIAHFVKTITLLANKISNRTREDNSS